MDYNRLRSRQDQLEAQAAIAKSQNFKMEKEIQRLKTDINYIKHLAKHEHEMAAMDELVFKEKLQNPTPQTQIPKNQTPQNPIHKN